jgi:transposase InsO family protein
LEADVVLKVVTMAELRFEVLLEPERVGETVADVCRRYGISRDTYYRYRRRYLAEGIEGLEDRSRRPKTSPTRISSDIELRIVDMRRAHPRWGARRIRAELERAGLEAPAVSTVHQTLRRNGLVADQPRRKTKANIRFEREVSNDLWQIDATRILLADDTVAWVVDMIDDHSRYLLAAIAGEKATTDLAWDVFEIAASRYGLPRQVLSDNGLAFTGRLHGVKVAFEANLTDLGVQLINASPYHPQTLGKLERFHRTLKEWLTDQGPAQDLDHLQELLDGFRFHYNRQRPHQGIDDQTPEERFNNQPQPAQIQPTQPLIAGQATYPPHSILRKVTATGNIGYNGKLIQVGYRWAGARVRVVPVGDLVHIYHGEQPVRVVVIDPDHYYQPLKPRKPKRKEPTTKIA